MTTKRKVNALLSLAKQYGANRLEAACLRAMTFENTSIKAKWFLNFIIQVSYEKTPQALISH